VPGGVNKGTRSASAALAVLVALAMAAPSPTSGAHSSRHSHVGDGRGGIAKRKIGTFASPTYIAHAPGAPGFLYVVEQPGAVAVIEHGHVRHRRFLAIKGRVSSGGERGLLSIAFDPRYRRNHLFYAYYTNRRGNIEIDQFHASSNTHVAASSRRRVIVIPHPGEANHNGGQLQFGPDGYLYAGTGDGGGGGDPHENAQNKHVLLGKLLRIDPHKHGSRPYTVPRGNPYVGRPGRDEIYALGLRNPFRFSFDHGHILIGDVGQDRYEEVDYEGHRALRGANFGWDHFEGFHRFNYPGDNEAPRPKHRYRPPIFEYSHGANRCAIIGGYVVRNPRLRSLRGRYLYTDNCAGGLRSFVPHRRRGRRDRGLGIHVPSPSSFGEGPNGTIYVASLPGPVYKLVHR
jgi:glucose/arabinose dehydrogenase